MGLGISRAISYLGEASKKLGKSGSRSLVLRSFSHFSVSASDAFESRVALSQ